jgi:hypothetical protein
MNDEGLADAKAANPFVYPDFTQELIQGWEVPASRARSSAGSSHAECRTRRLAVVVVEPPAQLRQDTFGVPVGSRLPVARSRVASLQSICTIHCATSASPG